MTLERKMKKKLLEYFTACDERPVTNQIGISRTGQTQIGPIQRGGGISLWTNPCAPEIRRDIINLLMEINEPNNKQREYALRPFKNNFPDGKNGQSFSLNREQVSIIKSALSQPLWDVCDFEELKENVDASFVNELEIIGYKIIKQRQ